jgi:hypothetical protein
VVYDDARFGNFNIWMTEFTIIPPPVPALSPWGIGALVAGLLAESFIQRGS